MSEPLLFEWEGGGKPDLFEERGMKKVGYGPNFSGDLIYQHGIICGSALCPCGIKPR
jgi:hypothetical protein